MNVRLNKSQFTAIEGAFKVLKENPNSTAGIDIIKESLEACFPYKFEIHVVNNPNDPPFIMSVFPEIGMVDRIIRAVNDGSPSKDIRILWEKNTNWVIEIDQRILSNLIFTEKELTAILMHEVGHVTVSGSIPNRVGMILKYELAKTSLHNKILLKEKIFRNLLSLPILDACVSDRKLDAKGIKEEIKADHFAAKMGYKEDLSSALTKLSKMGSTNRDSLNDKISKTMNFSLRTLDDFQARNDKLAKKSLLDVKEGIASPYISNVIEEMTRQIFEDGETFYEGKKINYMHELANDLIGDYYLTEFFQLGGSHLKRIDPAEIDYIGLKIQGIESNDDKMMIVSYIHTKLDMVEYYISIVENPRLAKKFDVPHTLAQLYDMKKRLLMYRTEAIKAKIPEKNKGILVAWPTGYEG